jgi:hypothetical protein
MKTTSLAAQSECESPSMWALWRQFYPLAMSDFTMALGDTLRTIALGRFPHPDVTFAVIGVVKSIAVCLESPIITILHASTALSVDHQSHRALGRFTYILSGFLTFIFLALCVEPISGWLLCDVFGLSPSVAKRALVALIFMVPWPASIACRRFFQGILIRNRQEKEMSYAALMRLLFTALVLMIGYRLELDAIFIAVLSLIGAVILEALMVLYYARKAPRAASRDTHAHLHTVKNIANYYVPLGSTSVVVWMGRAALVAIIAHANNGMLAVAGWTVASGFFLPIANSTRMLQQMVIAAPKQVSHRLLFRFSLMIGSCACLPMIFLAFMAPGKSLLLILMGDNSLMLQALLPSLQALVFLPCLVALENYLQGRLILLGAFWWINCTTIINIGTMLIVCSILLFFGVSGALAAALATLGALLIEIVLLSFGVARRGGS